MSTDAAAHSPMFSMATVASLKFAGDFERAAELLYGSA
jgi:hypothetical protein